MPTRNATDRTHSPDGSKTISQLDREHKAVLDAVPSVARCARPGCEEWRVDGTAAETRVAYAEHMAIAHPDRLKVETTSQRRKRERSEAEQAAAARAAEYADDGRTALAAMDAGEPQRPPPLPPPLRPTRQRWSRELALERIRVFAAEHGHPPASMDFRTNPFLPAPNALRRLFGGVAGAVEAAGFPRPTKGTKYERGAGPRPLPPVAPPRPPTAVSAPESPSPVSLAVRADPEPEKPVERVQPRAPADIEELARRFEAMAGVLRALDDLGDSLGAERRRSLADACLQLLGEFTRSVFA